MGAPPGCLVPGPGMLRAGGSWPGVQIPNKRGGWGVGSGVAGMYEGHA